MLLALVGFAAVTQVRSNQVDDTYAGLREQDLIDILNGLAGTSQRAEAENVDDIRLPAAPERVLRDVIELDAEPYGGPAQEGSSP